LCLTCHIKDTSHSSCKRSHMFVYLNFSLGTINGRPPGDFSGFSNVDLWSHTGRSSHDALKYAHPKPFRMSFEGELGGLPILLLIHSKYDVLTLGGLLVASVRRSQRLPCGCTLGKSQLLTAN
jgi:hypothetical protein